MCRAIRSNGGSAVGKACSCRNDVICAGGQIDGHALITRVSDSYGLFFGSLRISISGRAEVQSCWVGRDIVCPRQHGHFGGCGFVAIFGDDGNISRAFAHGSNNTVVYCSDTWIIAAPRHIFIGDAAWLHRGGESAGVALN